MTQRKFSAHVWMVALWSITLLASHANAQTTAPALPAAATAVPSKSAFEGYQPFSDDKMTSWKAANDEVARIGGWREYAKQAQQVENTPATAAGDSKPKATP